MSQSFSFDHLWQMSEAEYRQLVYVPVGDGRRTTRTYLRIALWAVFGVLLLSFRYTAGFGVLVLIGALVAVFWPNLMRRAQDQERIHTPYLTEAVHSGADQDGFWLSSSRFDIRVHWRALQVWELKDGWLRLSTTSVPAVFLPVEAMKYRGVLNQVLACARAHGNEFGSPGATRVAAKAT